jgi:hypothetical protein
MNLAKYLEQQGRGFGGDEEKHWADLVPVFDKARTKAGMEAILRGLLETSHYFTKKRQRLEVLC